MESGLQELKFSRYNQKVELSGKLFLYNALTGGYATTFPGGHVEQNEIFQKSIIREVWEETGLTIESPKLCGLYHWHEDGVHSVIMLYKAEKFIGELKSSEEGQVYWIPLEELKTRELATGMKYVLQILGADQVNECYMHLESEGYVGDLY